jgi:hypothetical protein
MWSAACWKFCATSFTLTIVFDSPHVCKYLTHPLIALVKVKKGMSTYPIWGTFLGFSIYMWVLSVNLIWYMGRVCFWEKLAEISECLFFKLCWILVNVNQNLKLFIDFKSHVVFFFGAKFCHKGIFCENHLPNSPHFKGGKKVKFSMSRL